MTLNEIITALDNAGIDNSGHEALLLASHFTGFGIPSLLCEKNAELNCPEILEAVKRRIKREPLQYILGEWEFMALPFRVNPDCLIPRADTELLCEFAINRLPPDGKCLDLCTGSGCIAIAVAHYRPDCAVTAVEKYEKTLECAIANARLNHTDINFIKGDVFDGVPNGEKFDIIVSNPPYVTADEIDFLEPELSYEPQFALTDGGDGLSVIKAVIDNYKNSLKSGGILAIEHGYLQGSSVRKLISVIGVPNTLKDLEGRDRVTFAQKK